MSAKHIRELVRSRRKNEAGIALLAVVWTLTLLAVIAVVLTSETRVEARIASNLANAAKAGAAADAGIEVAIYRLLRKRANQGGVSVPTNGTSYDWAFGDCVVQISVQDEVGKLNMNWAPPNILTAVFEFVGVDQGVAVALADAVADYRDADSLRRIQGAEADEYDAAGVPWRPKNGPFQAVDELQRVLGITPEIYSTVKPMFTTHSLGSSVDPALASEALALALSQIDFKSFATTPGYAYSIRARAKHASGASFTRRATVQLYNDSEPVRYLSWRRER